VNELFIGAAFLFGVLGGFIVNASLTAACTFGKTRSDAERMNNMMKCDTAQEENNFSVFIFSL